jgi:hypothetical protein
MNWKLLGLLAASLCLPAGTCGSVLRGHVPDGWAHGPQGNWVKSFGTVDLESGALIRREGSSLRVEVSNRGDREIEVLGADLVDTDVRESLKVGVKILPGSAREIRFAFKREVQGTRCSVLLQLSSGALTIDLRSP